MQSKLKGIFSTVKRAVLSKAFLRSTLAIACAVVLTTCFANLEKYVVVDGGNTYHVTTYANDATDVLGMVGVNLESEDVVETVAEGSTTFITIDRMAIQTELDGLSSHFDSIAYDSIGDLSDAFCNLGVEPKDKVEFVYKTVKTTIKYKSVTKYSDELKRGETKTTKGKNGKKETVYVTKIVNGVEESTTVHSEKITVEPVDEVKIIGTYYEFKNPEAVKTSDDMNCISEIVPSEPIELDANGHPVSYKNIITGKGTAYCKGTTCATGVKAKPGYVAVDPKEIPYGTKLYIVSADGKYHYGYAIAADTGGFAKNPNSTIVCDLRFNKYDDCIKFGKRNIIIYVL